MKSSYAALGVVGLALAGLWFAGGGTTVPPQPAAASEQVRVSAPLSHENLTVYFVHGTDAVKDAKVITLQEAIESGLAIVHETGDVNTLAVENLSPDHELFIQDGEMIRGGKQDRMIAVDLLLPPNSGRISFPAHCVEAGRWTARGGEATTHFNKCDAIAVGNGLKLANIYRDQSEVWKNVKENQDKLSQNLGVKVNDSMSETSFQLTLENRMLQARVAQFEAALKAAGHDSNHVVGVVFVINGQVTAAEIYGSNVLFKKAWPKLLRSAATEAVAEKTDKQMPPAPTAREVERFLAVGRNLTPQVTTERSNRTTNELVLGELPNSSVRNSVRNTQLGPTQLDSRAPDLLTPAQQNLNPTLTGRSGATRSQLVRSGGEVGQRVNNPPVRLAPEPIDMNNPTLGERVQSGVPQPTTPEGNRLKLNRVDNPAVVVTEARDPSRGNAVFHRSYLKK